MCQNTLTHLEGKFLMQSQDTENQTVFIFDVLICTVKQNSRNTASKWKKQIVQDSENYERLTHYEQTGSPVMHKNSKHGIKSKHEEAAKQ